MKKQLFCVALMAGALTACGPGVPQLGKASIDEVIAAMTLEEKAHLVIGTGMAGFTGDSAVIGETHSLVPGAAGTTYAIERLGIPAVVLADGPAGLRISPTRDGDSATYYCTHFPIGTLLASTWNQELVESVGKAIGNEVLEYGADVLLAPALNIHRNPLCGRNFEYYSEDPVVSGKIAAAYVRGVQSNGVGTSIKHYAANNQETNRQTANSQIDERALREIYLSAFEYVVKTARPATIMASYNRLNGYYACENRHLLTEILREEWGFDGVVISDWGACADLAKAVKAGMDLEMPDSHGIHARKLKAALKAGEISEEDIAKAAGRIEKLVKKYAPDNRAKKDTSDAHEIAKQLACESAVLLKNDGVLPLDTAKKIAFIGPYTNNHEIKSSWSFTGDSKDCVTIQEAAEKVFDASRTTYAEGCPVIGNDVELIGFTETTPKKYSEEELAAMEQSALQAAKEADLVVMPMGEHYLQSGEATSRAMIDVPEIQMELFHKVLAVNPNVVVVLFNGRPLDLREISAKAKAILEVWFPGTEGGSAVVDVLTGKKNPSGHLPMSFPYCVGQAPVSYNEYSTGRPNLPGMKERFRSKYLDIPNAPLYPFGYGLSYTTFDISAVTLDQNEMDKNGRIAAHVTVKNTGDTAGCDVVQLYIRDDYSDVVRPVRELKGFRRVELAPGKEQEVTFYITEEDLRYYRLDGTFGSEPGTFTVFVGDSSTTENSAVFTLK